MVHAALMGVVHGLGDLLDILGRFARRQRSLHLDDFVQARPVDVVHRGVVRPLMLSNEVNSGDVGVLQLPGGLGPTAELVDGRLGWQSCRTAP